MVAASGQMTRLIIGTEWTKGKEQKKVSVMI